MAKCPGFAYPSFSFKVRKEVLGRRSKCLIPKHLFDSCSPCRDSVGWTVSFQRCGVHIPCILFMVSRYALFRASCFLSDLRTVAILPAAATGISCASQLCDRLLLSVRGATGTWARLLLLQANRVQSRYVIQAANSF